MVSLCLGASCGQVRLCLTLARLPGLPLDPLLKLIDDDSSG